MILTNEEYEIHIREEGMYRGKTVFMSLYTDDQLQYMLYIYTTEETPLLSRKELEKQIVDNIQNCYDNCNPFNPLNELMNGFITQYNRYLLDGTEKFMDVSIDDYINNQDKLLISLINKGYEEFYRDYGLTRSLVSEDIRKLHNINLYR